MQWPTKSENIGTIAQNLEWQYFPRDSNLPIIVARARIPCRLTAGKALILSFPCYTMVSTCYFAEHLSDVSDHQY